MNPHFAVINNHKKEKLLGDLILTYSNGVFITTLPNSHTPEIIIGQGGTKSRAAHSWSYAIAKGLGDGSNGVITIENAK